MFFLCSQDKFQPARSAALGSILNTLEQYSVQKVATRIVPNVSCVTIDPFKTVRTSAFKVLDKSMNILKEHAETLPEKPGLLNKIFLEPMKKIRNF